MLLSHTVALLSAIARSDTAVFIRLTASLGEEFHVFVEYLWKVLGKDALRDFTKVVQRIIGTSA
jgi:hypothetical protein